METNHESHERPNIVSIVDKPVLFLIRKTRRVLKWAPMEDKLLMFVAGNFGQRNWNAIASHFPGRTAVQCSARYNRIKPGYHRGLWTVKEDSSLRKLVKLYGKDWSRLSKVMGNRSGKQIRDRYINTLDPGLKRGRFTKEEDRLIQSLYMKFGSKWTTIATYLTGRSGDMVKNRFNSVIREIIKTNKESAMFMTKDSSEELSFGECVNLGNEGGGGHTDDLCNLEQSGEDSSSSR
jgi:hypothetical protein